MSEHIHHLRYELDIKAVETPRSQAEAEAQENRNLGFCDTLIVGQTITYENNSYSQLWHSFDGRNELNVMNPHDEFKFWLMMAKDLAGKPGLDTNRRAFAQYVFDAFWVALRGEEGAEESK